MRNLLIEQHYRKNFERFSKMIARRFQNRLNVAEEAVQEAYLRAIKYFHTFNTEIKPFEHWFATILNNAVKDLQREEKAGGMKYDLDSAEGFMEINVVNTMYNIIRVHYEIEIHREREILYYFFQLGLKPREICQIVDSRTIHAIKSVIYRFKQSLKESGI